MRVTCRIVTGRRYIKPPTGNQRRRSRRLPHCLRVIAQGFAGLSEADANTWLEQALRRQTGTDDTHPALADRLASLGQPARLEARPDEAAARHYLGATLDDVTAAFDALWLDRVKDGWQQRHEYAREAQNKLADLEMKAARGELTPEEAFNRAQWTEEFHSADAALPLYEAAARVTAAAGDDNRDAHAAAAHLAAGRLLLARDESTGVARIEQAIAMNHWLTLNGCREVIGYYLRNGDNLAAQPWRDRAHARAEKEDAARMERATLPFKKIYFSHDLKDDALDAMHAVFARCPEIDCVYLVRKTLIHFPEMPLYVVGYRNRLFHRSDKKTAAITQRLIDELECPGEFFVLPLTGTNAPLEGILKKITGAKIYAR